MHDDNNGGDYGSRGTDRFFESADPRIGIDGRARQSLEEVGLWTAGVATEGPPEKK